MPGHLRRATSGIFSALLGWLAAFLVTLPFQLVELGRNAAPGLALLDLVQGLALWAAFTGAVGLTAALVIAAPAAVMLTPDSVRRYRRALVLAISGIAVHQVGKRLGTWEALQRDHAHNPFDSSLFWMYSLFAVVFSFVTVSVYARHDIIKRKHQQR